MASQDASLPSHMEPEVWEAPGLEPDDNLQSGGFILLIRSTVRHGMTIGWKTKADENCPPLHGQKGRSFCHLRAPLGGESLSTPHKKKKQNGNKSHFSSLEEAARQRQHGHQAKGQQRGSAAHRQVVLRQQLRASREAAKEPETGLPVFRSPAKSDSLLVVYMETTTKHRKAKKPLGDAWSHQGK